MIAEVLPKTTSDDAAPHRGLAKLIFFFDLWLCRFQHVFEYSGSRTCIFRAQLNEIRRIHTFPSGARLTPGDCIIALHFWNEQVPAFPERGPTIGWALRMNRAISSSLCELTCYFRAHPELSSVSAVRIIAPVGTLERTEQLLRILMRHGFERSVSQHIGIGTRIGWFFENLYVSLLVLAQNRRALRRNTFRRWRLEVYLQREALERRYAFDSSLAHSPKQPV
jgi:hypothetical protein